MSKQTHQADFFEQAGTSSTTAVCGALLRRGSTRGLPPFSLAANKGHSETLIRGAYCDSAEDDEAGILRYASDRSTRNGQDRAQIEARVQLITLGDFPVFSGGCTGGHVDGVAVVPLARTRLTFGDTERHLARLAELNVQEAVP